MMGTRNQIAKVGAAVWLFALVAAVLAYVLPQALLEAVPALLVNVVNVVTSFVS